MENICFVLGGIALTEKFDFDELLKYVGARQIPVDAKFKFFSYGNSDLKKALQQSRLRKFFEYLLHKKILIHFDVLHYMHFAMIDILDSLIEEEDDSQYVTFRFYRELQSDMTEVLYMDYPRLHSLMCSYEFPNISTEKTSAFINDILDLYTDNLVYFDLNDSDNFTKELLRQIIKDKREKNDLLFLQGKKPFEISNGVFLQYLMRMIEIIDKKYFDNEASITNQLENMDVEYSKKLEVSFIDSKKSREIQVCDVICGFVGKLFNFLAQNVNGEISRWINELSLDSNEYKTLKDFLDLLTLSDNTYKILLKKQSPYL